MGMIPTKIGWTTYEEVVGMGTQDIMTIGKVVKVSGPKYKERTIMKINPSISYGNKSLGVLGLVLLNKSKILKFAVTKETATQLIKNGILTDVRTSNNRLETRYDSIGRLPKYADVNDLTTLLDFDDGEMQVCVGKYGESAFTIITPGASEVTYENARMILERIQYLGDNLGLPANLGIRNEEVTINTRKW